MNAKIGLLPLTLDTKPFFILPNSNHNFITFVIIFILFVTTNKTHECPIVTVIVITFPYVAHILKCTFIVLYPIYHLRCTLVCLSPYVLGCTFVSLSPCVLGCTFVYLNPYVLGYTSVYLSPYVLGCTFVRMSSYVGGRMYVCMFEPICTRIYIYM